MKTAVITGGSQGIGRALVHRFTRQGFDVTTCSRNQPGLDSLQAEVAEINPKSKYFSLAVDLSRKSEVELFITFIKQKQIEVEVLINNAGVFLPGEIHSEEDGNLEKMMNTNLYSAYHLTRGLIQAMIDRKRGYVFNICSIASLDAYPQGSSYTISKFAMLGFNKSLRREMQDRGVRVTAVLPGAVKTSSWDGVDIPEERFIRPDDIAETVWSAYCMSDSTVIEEIIIRPQLGDI